MIETLSIRNFKVLREVDLRLRPLTLVVGPNASGKSTILEALQRTLGYLSQGASWLRFADQSFRSKNPKGLPELSGSGYFAGKHLSFTLRFNEEGLMPEKVQCTWDGKEFGVKAVVLRKLEEDIHPPQALSMKVELLAAPSYPKDIQTVLPSDGEGLSSFLASLSVEYPTQFKEIVRKLSTIVPAVENIRLRRAFVEESQNETVRRHVGYELLFDMRGAEGVPASAISEGTLLTLGLLTVLSSPKAPQLVLIDDVERGLHPKALGDLIHQFRLLQRENPELQIIATSHSPYLLDFLKAEEILLTSLDQDGYAAVKPLTDHPEYERWKDLMAPGEFWSTVGESWVAEQAVK